MRANTSSAVMQQRHESRDSLDDFPTPPWATRALCEWLIHHKDIDLFMCNVLEPACNRGYMARALDEYFDSVVAQDIHHYGAEHYEHAIECNDYLTGGEWQGFDFMITNPPFVLATEFIQKALPTVQIGVAVLVRTAFLESADRYESLFSKTPPSYVLQFVERVPMIKGRCTDYIIEKDEAGFVIGRKKVTTATAYCWLVWLKEDTTGFTQLNWIPPCRKQLEKPEDYR